MSADWASSRSTVSSWLRTDSIHARKHDVEVMAIVVPADTVDSGAVVRPSIMVRNNGTRPATFTAWLRLGAGYVESAPVTDLARLGTTWSSNRLQRILQGKTVTGMDPMDNADKAGLPILLFVGDRDVRTPAWHAKNFYRAVKDQVPAKLEIIEDMPHQLPWYYSHYTKMLNLIEGYLATD